MTEGLIAEADTLYGLPLSEFTPARDARAKELKGEDAALATAVKALRKPAVAAWVVNLLVRREAEQVRQLVSVGAALREAQAALDGAELRELTRQRRQLTAAVTTRARQLAMELGHRVTEAVADAVEATLTAAMLDEGAAAAVRSGLLVAPLQATGVDAVDLAGAVAVADLGGFAATPTPAALHVVADAAPPARPDARARTKAQAALAAAQQRLTSAEAGCAEADEAVDALAARALQLQAEIDELRRRLADLESEAEDNDDELGEARAAHAAAESERSAAHAALDAARTALESVGGAPG